MIPLNVQPVEKKIQDTGGVLDVVSTFLTLQGEGPFAGHRSVFVRLAGCNLQCPLCDTDYTSSRERLTAKELYERVTLWYPTPSLVVITGGEPLRQDIGLFVGTCTNMGIQVQIETNGTLYRSDLPYVNKLLSIVCSPKTREVSKELLPHITAWKYIIEAGKVGDDGLPLSSLGEPFPPCRPVPWCNKVPIYVQPLDSQNEDNNKANRWEAVESCLKFGYRLSLQTHKLLNLP